jgi:hypothetical protein
MRENGRHYNIHADLLIKHDIKLEPCCFTTTRFDSWTGEIRRSRRRTSTKCSHSKWSRMAASRLSRPDCCAYAPQILSTRRNRHVAQARPLDFDALERRIHSTLLVGAASAADESEAGDIIGAETLSFVHDGRLGYLLGFREQCMRQLDRATMQAGLRVVDHS